MALSDSALRIVTLLPIVRAAEPFLDCLMLHTCRWGKLEETPDDVVDGEERAEAPQKSRRQRKREREEAEAEVRVL